MQVNVNSIVVLNALFILGFLHDKYLDLNFIASAYGIKAIKHKVYLTFFLQLKEMPMFMLFVEIGIHLPLIPNNSQFLWFLPKVRFNIVLIAFNECCTIILIAFIFYFFLALLIATLKWARHKPSPQSNNS